VVDISVPARVYFTETVQYIPKGLRGMILCHIEAEPPIDFVTWTKNKRLFDPFETPGVMALKNGSLLIDKVKIGTKLVRGNCMCKEMPVIPANRVVDKKRTIGKNGWLRRRRG
jgi:hypothetical protein